MDCTNWLREKLKDGETHLCVNVRIDAKKAGFNRAELKKARTALGVKTFHYFDEFGASPNWFWYLEVNK